MTGLAPEQNARAHHLGTWNGHPEDDRIRSDVKSAATTNLNQAEYESQPILPFQVSALYHLHSAVDTG